MILLMSIQDDFSFLLQYQSAVIERNILQKSAFWSLSFVSSCCYFVWWILNANLVLPREPIICSHWEHSWTVKCTNLMIFQSSSWCYFPVLSLVTFHSKSSIWRLYKSQLWKQTCTLFICMLFLKHFLNFSACRNFLFFFLIGHLVCKMAKESTDINTWVDKAGGLLLRLSWKCSAASLKCCIMAHRESRVTMGGPEFCVYVCVCVYVWDRQTMSCIID